MLWTFAAVAVLAAEFARAMHDEAASTRNFKESVRARMIAVAGVNEVILALRADRKTGANHIDGDDDDEEAADPVRRLARGNGQWVKLAFLGTPCEVRVVDEGGKISLNRADANMLTLIMQNLEVPEEDAKVVVDSIQDWRDSDDFHLPNGAESEYYEGLDRPYMAKNAYFDTVEELLLVRGVTHDLFYGHDDVPGLRDIFSVFTKSRAPNAKSAPPAVMQALGGLDHDDAETLGQDRYKNGGQAALDQLKAKLQAAGVSTTNAIPKQMTIEARVRDATGRAVLAHVGAVINLDSSGEGLRVFRWYDSIFDESDQTAASGSAGDTAG